MTRRLLIVVVLCCSLCEAQGWKKRLLTAVEHISLGAGVEIGVSRLAGGPNKYTAGIVAAGLVAGFKEGSDAVAGRDTKKQAACHAFIQIAGAGLAAGIKH